ncbi:uncharacterized protein LOC110863068 [Folsomia candida]|uniref:Heat shock 70 kDa protein n=1 Tax=Folsomia candida TaxID=158441 RepID=A0A226F2M2_FOLCA|nr:uncharacterized protein LOC110863068 [Folsomia candida]XP_035714647.1 uncharacterized protein LOC110863068 [Folsomia candida]OXA63728.1 Heat shock 70 kDa protein [Folsomia candida]
MSDDDLDPHSRDQVPQIVGSPIRILELNEIGHTAQGRSSMRFNDKKTKEILSRADSLPFSILCITGEARQGKSYFLSCLIKYLQCLESGVKPTIELASNKEFFHFENGTERMTTGVWMWSHPFKLQQEDGTPYALFLMDSQGLFDKWTGNREWVGLAGFSLLASSCLIFNTVDSLRENVLEFFSTFCETTAHPLTELDDDKEEIGLKFFQKLVVLIRDWGLYDNIDYGCATGNSYILNRLLPDLKATKMHNRSRKLITDAFTEINCCLLPPPGEDAKRKEFQGHRAELSEKFYKKMYDFIEDLVVLGNIPVKTGIRSRATMLPEAFTAILDLYVQTYNKNETLSPNDLSMINMQASNEAAVQSCVKEYRTKMSPENAPISVDDLQELHSCVENEIMQNFRAIKKYGDADVKKKYEKDLTNKIKNIYVQIKRTYANSGKQKLDEIKSLAKQEFLQQIEIFMKPVDLKNVNQFITELISRSTRDVDKSASIAKIKMTDEDRKQLEEFFTAKGQELRDKCIVMQNNVDSVVQGQINLFERKINDTLENLGQTYGDHIPENVLTRAGKELESKMLKQLDAQLTQLQICPQNIVESRDKFSTALTKRMDHLQMENAQNQTRTTALLDDIVSKYAMEISKIWKQAVFTESYTVDENWMENLNQMYLPLQTKAVDEFEETCKIENVITLSKFKNTVKSKLEENFNFFVTETENILSKVKRLFTHHTQTFEQELQERIDLDDVISIPTPAKYDELCKHHLEMYQTALENEANKFPAFVLPISEIVTQISKEWVDILNGHVQQKLQNVDHQRDIIIKSLHEAEQLFLDQFNLNSITSVQDLSKRNDLAVNKAMKFFKNETSRLSETIRKEGEDSLMETLNEKWLNIQKQFTSSMQAHKLRLQENVSRNITEFQKNLEEKFGNSNSIEGKRVYQADEVRQFSTREFEKAICSLRQLSSSINCQDIICNEFVVKMELEFDSMANDVITQNKNNELAFMSFLQEAVHQTVKLNKEREDSIDILTNQALIIEKVITLVNLGNYVIHEDSVKRLAQNELQKYNMLQQQQRPQTPPIFNEPIPGTSSSFRSMLSNGENSSEDLNMDTSNNDTIPSPTTLPSKVSDFNAEAEIELLLENFRQFLDHQNLTVYDQDKIEIEKDNIIKTLLTKLDDKEMEHSDWPDKLKKILDKDSETFKKKVENQQRIDKDLATRAFNFYKAEINKHKSNSESAQFLTPQDLNDMHVSSKNTTMQKYTNLSPEHAEQLESLIEKQFEQMCLEQRENSALEPAIGIDLGTTFSCVAIFWEGKMTVIPNAHGKKTTPSYVAFNSDGSHLVGEPAKSQAFLYPASTIFDAKRLIGRPFYDEKVQEDIANWPFKVVQELGKPKIEVNGETYHPEQIGAKILVEMKHVAEAFLKRDVVNAVVTVPAYFNDGQRQATRDAGAMAGLNVIRIINEPTAAAFAYSLERQTTQQQSRHVLIYDFGGGTFDVSILHMHRNQIRTLTVNGDTHLGGEDFDSNIVAYCVEKFKAEHNIDLVLGRDDASNPFLQSKVQRRIRRLRHTCEQAKITLSEASTAHINLDLIHDDLDLNVDLTRQEFEAMNQNLFDKSLSLVEKALQDAKLGRDKIDEIVLVGGSTRIPKVQEMLTNYFGKPLSKSVNPDEAVACGAALQAAILTGNLATQMKSTKLNLGQRHRALVEMRVSDVTPYATGVELIDGTMSIIIPKNSPVPTKRTETYLTSYDNQTSVLIVIYEGERPMAVENHKVGEFYLNGVPPAGAGQQEIEVTMSIDNEGITHVTAVCNTSGVVQELIVTEHKGRMGAAERNALVEIN